MDQLHNQLLTMSSTLCNSLTLEQNSFFLTQFLRSFFTKIILSKPLQSSSIAFLQQLDTLIPSLLAKLSDPTFIFSLVDQLNESGSILYDFFLEEFITESDLTTD